MFRVHQALGLTAAFLVSFVNASTLFQGATIISFDTTSSQFEILNNASLLVENDRIVQLSGSNEVLASTNATEVIDASGKIISPGFIDTHHHLWQTAFKTLGSNTTLADYFGKFGAPGLSVQVFTAEDKYLGQLAGCFELLFSGTTTVLDHAHGNNNDENAEATLNATLESGIRAYFAHTVQSLPNYTFEDSLSTLESFAQDPRLNGTSLVQLGVAYDSFATDPAANVQQVWNAVQSNNLSVVTTHYLGGLWVGSDNSPTVLDQYGVLNTTVPVVFSHSGFIDAPNAQILRTRNQYISTTPESEFMYGQGQRYSYLVQDQASLGLDTHFTFSTDMVGQARMWLQKLRAQEMEKVLDLQQAPVNSPMSVQQAFYLITRAGGLALRRDDIGVIREGAKADLVVFNGNSPNMLGWYDPVAAIILHSNTGDISDVMVDGNFVKRNGSLTYDGYADVQRRFLQSSRKIQNIWLSTAWPPLTGLLGNSTPYGEAMVIDTLRGEGTGY